jgi:PAS domain S-box-containing protein
METNPEGNVGNNPANVPELANEENRLASLRSYHILDTAEEQDFDELTTLASVICQTPVALISLVDKDRQWFKSHKGTDVTETPRDYSFCAHTIAAPVPIMIVADLGKDQRFANNPLVTGDPHVVFYAGVPLVNKDGFAMGSLCVMDMEVRELTTDQQLALKILAKQVVDKLEKRKNVLELQELMNEELVTSQRRLTDANHRLAESEARFRNLIEQSPVAISVLKGPDLIIDCANEMILNIWGKKRSVLRKPLQTVFPEPGAKPFLQLLYDVFLTGKPYAGNEAKVTIERDGVPADLFINFVFQPVFANDGSVTDVIVVANDVTEQVTSRQMLKKTNEELSLLAEQFSYISNIIPQQVWTATPDGVVDFVNEQTLRYFGKSEKELMGPGWLDVIHPDDREAVIKAWGHSLATGEPYQTEYRLLSKDNGYVWYLARAVAIKENGQIKKWFATNTDIDGHKQLEQHKSDFISIASHELKTPITSLRASLQLLDRVKNTPHSPVLPKLIDQSNRGMQKISSLIDRLLSVSRINEGQLHLKRVKFNLLELLNESCAHIKTEGKHQIIIEGDEQLSAFADENLIEQVVVNFLNNAVKYAFNSNKITISFQQLDNVVKIAVTDEGPGIPPDKTAHLFDRYYRVDYSGRQYSGLGLGLYISSEIIRHHNGQIGVDSVLGEGSTFWFTLPVANDGQKG